MRRIMLLAVLVGLAIAALTAPSGAQTKPRCIARYEAQRLGYVDCGTDQYVR